MVVENLFDVGDKIRLSVNIKVLGVDTDPTVLTFKIKDPDGVVTESIFPTNIVNDSLGNFHIDVLITKPGRHVYRWEATGTAHGAEEKDFLVSETEFD